MYSMTDTSVYGDNEHLFTLLNKSLCTSSQVGVQILGYPKISCGLYIVYEIFCILCLQHSLSYSHFAIAKQEQFIIRGPHSS